MVSWSDDHSSENSHQYVDSASDEGIIKIPETMDDSDFEGTDPDVLCNEHSLPAKRRVAFQGIHTGRRFFACAVKEGRNCGLVEWVDPFWPALMENALTKLWDRYEECRRSKIEENLESSFVVHNLTQQKIKLQASYERLVEDVNGLLDAQEQRAQMQRDKMQNKPDEKKLQEKYDMLKNLTVSQANVIRNMKLKLAEEKIKLQAHINELEKVVDQTKLKLSGIKAILDE
ncbi:hypothetical protein VPH35_032251 [Triticum aestivum]